MTRSLEHEAALSAISTWWRGSQTNGRPIFRLFGFAGTGKTTLARTIAEGVDGQVAFAAYTGKAALVMQQQGCPGASTLHSLIYTPIESTGRDRRPRIEFRVNPQSPAASAALIVIDECSMIDADLARDLLSFRKPVLVLGDPGQLPPINGDGYFTAAKPDILLTEVHRQAADNPIVQLATLARRGRFIPPGPYGASQVVGPTALDLQRIIQADQMLVGTNALRLRLNGSLRYLQGRPNNAPAPGDRLVCLKNNRNKNLLNGSLWTVDEIRPSRHDGSDQLYVTSDNDGKSAQKPRRLAISVRREYFAGEEERLSPEQRQRSDAFTYAYALTVHKAQGSQWDNVVLFNEADKLGDYPQRWLYSGITRAAESLTLITQRTVA